MKIDQELTDPLKRAWHKFIERTEPLRPELHRFCRSLTGSVWDGEDLVQDTLMRTFVRCAGLTHPIENPRAFLFRIASNLWIDRLRTTHEWPTSNVPETIQPEVPSFPEIRDAANHLVSNLPPMERAAILLKDVFDLSIDEVSTALETTQGAAKSALHRGRMKLKSASDKPAPARRSTAHVSAALLDRFVDAFNAHDIKGLTALMREDAIGEIVGLGSEFGRGNIGRESGNSTLYVTLFMASEPLRAERREYLGEQIVIIWSGTPDNEGLNDMIRFEERESAIAHFRYYYFCPETLTEVGASLGVRVKTNGYRFEL